jgi:hypothetical protein
MDDNYIRSGKPIKIKPRPTGVFTSDGIEIKEFDLITSYQNNNYPVEVYWDEDLKEFVTSNYHSTLSLKFSINSESRIVGSTYINNPIAP